jgi:tetratricopeptide (TPR) repeat protein
MITALTTAIRNHIWKSELALWSDVKDKSGSKARGHNNLGVAYSREDRFDEAKREYSIAIGLYPDFADTHYNLGLVYMEKGLKDKAAGEFKEALRIRPDFIEAKRALVKTGVR